MDGGYHVIGVWGPGDREKGLEARDGGQERPALVSLSLWERHSPVPLLLWERHSPFPLSLWERHSPFPLSLWERVGVRV